MSSVRDIERDIALIGQLDAVPTILQVLCDITGMGFAAVARVTEGTWTACAVLDQIAFGVKPGAALDVNTTLCREVRASGSPIIIDHASEDPLYNRHMTPKLYGIESYASVPIVFPDGTYFGNLCALDRKPASVSGPAIVSMFVQFANLIAMQLHNQMKSELVQAALIEERAARDLRDQLMSAMRHDLRVPIGSIALSCQRLKTHASDPATVFAIASDMAVNARRASEMLADTADAADAVDADVGRRSEDFVVELALVDRIDEGLFGVVADVQGAHSGREIEWQFDIARPVRVDRGRILQLAANLLQNAMQHSAPLGKARITAATTANEFSLSVWNDGRGIEAERLVDPCLPTWAASAGRRRARLGLGLYISSKIVKAHGGSLTVTSDRRSGTTVVAVLPA